MTEKYCPVCELIHKEEYGRCCYCDGELLERFENSNGEDKKCPICVDQVEMA